MGDYVATFFSHFGAMSFKKKCDKEGYPAVIMPVPRNLSSSCGTCVKFTGLAETVKNWNCDELEQLAKILEGGGCFRLYGIVRKDAESVWYGFRIFIVRAWHCFLLWSFFLNSRFERATMNL